MGTAMEEALLEFVAECQEMLDSISSCLNSIEHDGCQQELVHNIYRDVHTIKGSSQLFGIKSIGCLAQVMEASLVPFREGLGNLTVNHIDCLYLCLDYIGEQLTAFQQTGVEVSDENRLHSLVATMAVNGLEAVGGSPGGFAKPASSCPDLPAATTPKPAGQPSEPMNTSQETAAAAAPEPPPILQTPPPAPQPAPKAQAPSQPAPATSEHIEGLHLFDEEEAPVEQAPEAPETPKPETMEDQEPASQPPPAAESKDTKSPTPKSDSTGSSGRSDPADTTVRVQTQLLDNLINLTSEMVLARNQIMQMVESHRIQQLQAVSQQINTLTSKLQSEVMKTRMQPIGNILSRFHRVVRDLARDLGKQVDLQLNGTETELDRTLIEAIKDPLTHVVRNSVDHGIEATEVRLTAGKPSTGTLTINAYQEGGQVAIEIRDDGGGLDPIKIRKRALANRIITEAEAQALSDRDTFRLIFVPGFSTAEKVSSVSGRGVGMDVVRTNLEQIGGFVDLDSTLGKGTRITLRVPLTLAIVPALLVRTARRTFAFPQTKIVELIRIDLTEDSDAIEDLYGKPVFRLRGQLLPLLKLSESIGKDSDPQDKEALHIVVLRDGSSTFGVIVDEIDNSVEIVVKPLPTFLKQLKIYDGATILGSGEIALVLNPLGMLQSAAKFQGSNDTAREPQGETTKSQHHFVEYVTVRLGNNRPYAIPLDLVFRLEQIQAKEINGEGGDAVVHYREGLLPVVDLTSKELASEPLVPLVVVKNQDNLVGLKVGEIADVISSEHNVKKSLTQSPHLVGNLYHDEKVIPVLSIQDILQDAQEGKAVGFLEAA